MEMNGKSVDMDMDMDLKFYGKPAHCTAATWNRRVKFSHTKKLKKTIVKIRQQLACAFTAYLYDLRHGVDRTP